jgi:hypothetical protein
MLYNNFYPGFIIFCTGTLSVIKHISNIPVLSLRANTMVGCVYVSLYLSNAWLTAYLSYSCPGNPADETYYDCTPPLANAALNFISPVFYHFSFTCGALLFAVNLSVYKEKI